jgi:hypothetical protein
MLFLPTPRSLYREFLRVLKTIPETYQESMKQELRRHFQGNSMLQADTAMDIEKGNRLLAMMKKKWGLNNNNGFKE